MREKLLLIISIALILLSTGCQKTEETTELDSPFLLKDTNTIYQNMGYIYQTDIKEHTIYLTEDNPTVLNQMALIIEEGHKYSTNLIGSAVPVKIYIGTEKDVSGVTKHGVFIHEDYFTKETNGLLFSSLVQNKIPAWLSFSIENQLLDTPHKYLEEELSQSEIEVLADINKESETSHIPLLSDAWYIPDFLETKESEKESVQKSHYQFTKHLIEEEMLLDIIDSFLLSNTNGVDKTRTYWNVFTSNILDIKSKDSIDCLLYTYGIEDDTTCIKMPLKSANISIQYQGEKYIDPTLKNLSDKQIDEQIYPDFVPHWGIEQIMFIREEYEKALEFTEKQTKIEIENKIDIIVEPYRTGDYVGLASNDDIRIVYHFSTLEATLETLVHETTHFLLDDFSGNVYQPFSEGFASYTGFLYGDIHFDNTHVTGDDSKAHSLAKDVKTGKLAGNPLTGSIPEEITTYQEATSFVQYLIDTYEQDMFLDIYYNTSKTREVYGKDLDELIEEWLEFLNT